jgi:hypothetical protein
MGSIPQAVRSADEAQQQHDPPAHAAAPPPPQTAAAERAEQQRQQEAEQGAGQGSAPGEPFVNMGAWRGCRVRVRVGARRGAHHTPTHVLGLRDRCTPRAGLQTWLERRRQWTHKPPDYNPSSRKRRFACACGCWCMARPSVPRRQPVGGARAVRTWCRPRIAPAPAPCHVQAACHAGAAAVVCAPATACAAPRESAARCHAPAHAQHATCIALSCVHTRTRLRGVGRAAASQCRAGWWRATRACAPTCI